MVIFYSERISEDVGILVGDEHQHCVKSLRKKVGDTISFLDGNGGLYSGEITDISKKEVHIGIRNKEHYPENTPRLHIAIAPTKNMSRYEWFLEKSTEIGIHTITPIICKNSERKTLRLDRCRKILLSATKQSKRYYVPVIEEVTSLNAFLDKAEPGYICNYNIDNPHALLTLQKSKDTTLIIGPEGDFSTAELEKAISSGWQSVNISAYRLRTETAGLTAVQIFQNVNI